jgi:GMP reductase
MKDFLLSYDTVCLRPKKASLSSRDLAETSFTFLGRFCKLPVVPANMADVISAANALWMGNNGYFYIMHRFNHATYDFVSQANYKNIPFISISVGTKDYENELEAILRVPSWRVDCITIDVAHGHHENMEAPVKFIRKNFPNTKIIAGNVATGDGFTFLCRLGVDAIKVGIGGGSICTTRYKTGFHLPTLQSVYEANEALKLWGWDIPIIADGGAKHYGDIAKALTFGATMVMSGGWFASCIDSPAKIVDGKKVYRGSTSFEMKGSQRHVEGRTLELEEGFTYAQRMEEIRDAITSQISYAGGKDLGAFDTVDWERILPFH